MFAIEIAAGIAALSFVLIAAEPMVTSDPDPVARAAPHIHSCQRDHPIGNAQLERLKYADFSDGPKRDLQCFVRCFMERSLFYDQEGVLNSARAAFGMSYYYQQEHALATMNVCKHVAGLNDCDTAYQVFKCFKQSIIAL